MRFFRTRGLWLPLLLVALIGGASVVVLQSQTQKFYSDDPLEREPETQDASKAQSWEIILTFDLLQSLFATPGDLTPTRALNANTIDEVPDSNWFTNRIVARPFTAEEAVRGPINGPGPAKGPMVARPKGAGAAPGFRLVDSAGTLWFVQFDAPGQPEAATAASMVANNIFHALGYWQAEYFLAEVRPEDPTPDPKATVRLPSGNTRPFSREDIDEVFERSARQPNGAYRMLASRNLVGPGARPLGGFKSYGTRPDDPNDVVPHEHRRELRALHVFGAWTNLVDVKGGNTLDVAIPDGNRMVVRHYLQDVGSTFGTGALTPREWEEGFEDIYEGSPLWKRLVTFGLYRRPWQTVDYTENPSIGRFEGDEFDPVVWRPRVPAPALLNLRPDDAFWAARRVMAFSDDLIRTVVRTGAFSDPAAEKLLVDVLIKRRDKIGRTYLPAVNPIVGPALSSTGSLTFRNAAVEAGVATAPARYQAVWSNFDNLTGATKPIGETSGAQTNLTAPAGLPSAVGSYVQVAISAPSEAHPAWATPARVYFRRTADGWKLVGLER